MASNKHGIRCRSLPHDRRQCPDGIHVSKAEMRLSPRSLSGNPRDGRDVHRHGEGVGGVISTMQDIALGLPTAGRIPDTRCCFVEDRNGVLVETHRDVGNGNGKCHIQSNLQRDLHEDEQRRVFTMPGAVRFRSSTHEKPARFRLARERHRRCSAGFRTSKSAPKIRGLQQDKAIRVETNYGYAGPAATSFGRVTEPGITAAYQLTTERLRRLWTAMNVPSVVSRRRSRRAV